MSLTLQEIAEKLKRYDEILLLELLEISADDIVDRFMDIIENKADFLENNLEEEEEEDESLSTDNS